MTDWLIHPYDVILPWIQQYEGEFVSEADAALRCNVSERQIRNAKKYGMNDYLLDRMCIGLGLHPAEVIGQEMWIATGVNAPKIPKRKLTKAVA